MTEHRRLGRTGVRVSVLGLGCAGFGGVGSEPGLIGRGEDEAASFALMDRALELGVNLLDTADAYAGGRSEEIVGRWLASRRCRDEIVLATKVGTPLDGGVNHGGLSRRHILRQVEASLRRLQTDHIDLYLAHQVDTETALVETLRAFDDLVRAGKVRYVGACNIEAWRLDRAGWVAERTGTHRFEAVQNQYNLLRRHSQAEVLALAADQGMAVIPHSPLAGGWLSGKYRPGAAPPAGSRLELRPWPYGSLRRRPAEAVLEALEREAGRLELPMATLALAWVASDPSVTAVLTGPRTVAQLENCLTAVGTRLDSATRSEVVDALDAVADPTLV